MLGAERSGQVFLIKPTKDAIARKIFTGDWLTNLVHYVFSGAPNPYIWNEDALVCAYYRRKIVGVLVRIWFGTQLTVADATDMGWHAELRAYQLDTEFIPGRPVALRHP